MFIPNVRRHVLLPVAISLVGLTAACARSESAEAQRAESKSGEVAPAQSADTASGAAREAVARFNRSFAGYARSRNADSVASWFAADAMVLVNGAPAIRTRDSIRTFYDQFFQAMPIRDMTSVTEQITVSGTFAVETGTSTLSVGGPGQATPVTVAGKYLAVWRRQSDGRWLLWRHSPSSNVMQTR